MSAARAGAVVAIWNGIAEAAREEFHRWHESEHMPERVGIPGFRRGRRYRAVSGAPEYFTRYDLDGPEVLTGEAYLARLDAPTAWTLGVLPHFRDTSRALCRTVLSFGDGSSAWLATIRLNAAPHTAPEPIAEAVRSTAGQLGIIGVRLLGTDVAASGGKTREQAVRGTDLPVPACVILIEARSLDDARDAEDFLREQLGPSGMESGIYLLQYDLLAKDPR